MAEKDLKALFVHQLKDTFFAENAILKALPQMAEAAQSEELRGALAVHIKETEGQVKRFEKVFQIVGERPEGVECKAIQGIIEEGQEILQEFQGGEALDAGLIAAAQAVEHYEITRYGTLLAWAKQLGLSEAEELIKETLVEEENTDEVLPASLLLAARTAPASWPGWADAGCGPGRRNPRGPDRQPLLRRGVPEGLGQAARRWPSHIETPGAAAHARARPPRALPGRRAPRPAQPRRHHHPGDGGHDVGHRPDHDLHW